ASSLTTTVPLPDSYYGGAEPNFARSSQEDAEDVAPGGPWPDGGASPIIDAPLESLPPNPPPAHARVSSTDVPDGRDCLVMLEQLGVKYSPVEAKRGVETPIAVE